jgi:hypothetical protein
MDTDAQRSALRAAVYTGDGPAVVELLRRGGISDDTLQLAGDGLIAALTQRADGASELAGRLSQALRARGWEGDDDLADQLDGLLGTGPAPMLRPLRVDLDELMGILEGDPVYGGGRIDLETGEVWPQPAIDYAVEQGAEDEDAPDDPKRWLWVHCEGSARSYRDMEWFIGTVDDPARADQLARAIRARGPFRRFKDALSRWPGQLERWQAFSDERQRGRARSWLAAEGYRVASGRPFGGQPG